MLIVQLFDESLHEFKSAIWLLAQNIAAQKQVLQRRIDIQCALDLLFTTTEPKLVLLLVLTDFLYNLSYNYFSSRVEQSSWTGQAKYLIGGIV